MEDWLHFVLVFSPYIFDGVLPAYPERRMWALLVFAVEHYFTPRWYDDRDHVLEASQKARSALLEFGAIAEREGFPASVFTINLHTCICRYAVPERTAMCLYEIDLPCFCVGCTTRRWHGVQPLVAWTSWWSALCR